MDLLRGPSLEFVHQGRESIRAYCFKSSFTALDLIFLYDMNIRSLCAGFGPTLFRFFVTANTRNLDDMARWDWLRTN